MPDQEQEAAAFPEAPPEFPEPKEDPEPSLEEPVPAQAEPETEAPETIDVLNEASREPEQVTFAPGPGGTVRIHHGDWVAVISKENFDSVIEWYDNLSDV